MAYPSVSAMAAAWLSTAGDGAGPALVRSESTSLTACRFICHEGSAVAKHGLWYPPQIRLSGRYGRTYRTKESAESTKSTRRPTQAPTSHEQTVLDGRLMRSCSIAVARTLHNNERVSQSAVKQQERG